MTGVRRQEFAGAHEHADWPCEGQSCGSYVQGSASGQGWRGAGGEGSPGGRLRGRIDNPDHEERFACDKRLADSQFEVTRGQPGLSNGTKNAVGRFCRGTVLRILPIQLPRITHALKRHGGELSGQTIGRTSLKEDAEVLRASLSAMDKCRQQQFKDQCDENEQTHPEGDLFLSQ